MNNLLAQKNDLSLIIWLVVFLVLINFLWLKSPILGVILVILWLIGLMAGFLGNQLAAQLDLISQKTIGLIITLSLIIFLAATVFYIFILNIWWLYFILVLISWLIWKMAKKKNNLYKLDLSFIKIKASQKWPVIIYLILWVLALVIIITKQTTSPIRTPWEALPVFFFLIYFMLAAGLLKILIDNKKTPENSSIELKQKLILISLFYFLSLSIAWLIYKIGFGFDPFVHRAAENALAKLGYLSPKPLYYSGQYVLVVFISHLFVLPLNLIDKILVPVLAALTLPSLLYLNLKEWLITNKLKWLAILAALMFYLALFFNSLPQSLANLFLLWLILLNTIKDKIKFNFWYLNFLIMLVIFLIHPLTGIAAVIYLSINNLNTQTIKIKKWLKKIIYVGLSLLTPLFFMLGAWLGKIKINFDLKNLTYVLGLFKNFGHYLPFYSIYHLIYFYQANWLCLYALLLVSGAYFLWRHNYQNLVKKQIKVLLVLLINLVLLGLIKYGNIINYEQGEFIKRWGQIIVLITSPLALIGIYYIASRIKTLKNGQKILIGLMAALLTINLYLAYPRNDAFIKGRGYSVSQNDILTVNWIEQDAQNNSYVVLANQSVSAAALQEFGFKKYYNGLFYYPIPTSSPLYKLYLKMVYEGVKLDYIYQASHLTDVNQIYFVINNYWLDSQKIIGTASQITNKYKNINNQVWIFKFEIKKN